MTETLGKFHQKIHEDIYRTQICSWCRKHLKDGDKIYTVSSMSGIYLCSDCRHWVASPIDFSPEGTKELGTTSWKTAREIILWRDDCSCRICGKNYERDNPIEVHHIIPLKNGGTHHPKNLITLCEKHHKETFRNDYAGIELTDRLIQLGKQKVI